MISHDRIFKELLTVFFIDFIELFFPKVANYLEKDSIVFLDKEVFTDVIKGETHEVDIVVKGKFVGKEAFFLLHLESQAQQQADFGERLFKYFARLFEKYHLPIYPIVIFSFDSPKKQEPSNYKVTFPDLEVLSFNYQVIQLNRLDWKDFLNKPNPLASALMAKMQIAKAERPKVKLECLRMLASLKLNPAKTRLISGFIDTYLKLTAAEETILQQNIDKINLVEKEVVMEIVTSWMQKGIEQGLQQGLQQGRQEGEILIIKKLLNRKLGNLDSEILEKIEKLDLAKIEELADAILEINNISDLENWLSKHN